MSPGELGALSPATTARGGSFHPNPLSMAAGTNLPRGSITIRQAMAGRLVIIAWIAFTVSPRLWLLSEQGVILGEGRPELCFDVGLILGMPAPVAVPRAPLRARSD